RLESRRGRLESPLHGGISVRRECPLDASGRRARRGLEARRNHSCDSKRSQGIRHQPALLIPQGQTALPPNAPAGTNVSSFWDTNNVWIPLNNGTVQRVTYNNNLNPWRNQYVPLPWQWFQDASAFKFIAITEKVNLRFNV